MNSTVTAIDPAGKALADASSEALLASIEALTHAIHDAPHPDRKDHLRQQRALVRAEVLRRIGDAR